MLLREVNSAHSDNAEVLYWLGLAASGAECLDEAEAALERALQLGLQEARAFGELARVRVRRGYANAALELAEKACELSRGPKEQAWALVSLGQARLALEEYGEARRVFREANRLDPSNPYAEFALGMLADRERIYGEALAHLQKAADLSPEQAYTWMYLGHAALKGGRPDVAFQALRRALELGLPEVEVLGHIEDLLRGVDPQAVVALAGPLLTLAHDSRTKSALCFRLGYANSELGDRLQARAYYEQTLDYSDHFDARYNLALLLFEEGHYAEARLHLERAVITSPGDSDVERLLGKALSRDGEYGDAERVLLRAIAAGGEAAAINAELAYVFQQQGRFKRAVKVGTGALADLAAPEEQAALYSILGYCHEQLGHSELALEHFRDAVRLAPQDPEKLFSLGLSELNAGLVESAREHLNASVELRGDDSVSVALAQAELELGNRLAAESLLRQLLNSGERESAHILLVELLARTERVEEAIALANAGIERDPTSPIGWAAMSVAQMLGGDHEAARTALRKAEQLDLGNPWVEWARGANIQRTPFGPRMRTAG